MQSATKKAKTSHLRPNFVALALEVWPWQKIQGQNLDRLQNSPLTSTNWSTVTGVNFKIQVPYLLIVGNRGLVRVLEKKQDFVTFYRNPLHF